MFILYCYIGLIYSLVKVINFPREWFNKIENRLGYSKIKIDCMLLVIFFILFPFFFLADLKILYLKLSTLYYMRRASHELNKLGNTFKKYNINKENYFDKMFKDIEK